MDAVAIALYSTRVDRADTPSTQPAGDTKQAVGGGGGPLSLSQNGNKVRAPQHTRV